MLRRNWKLEKTKARLRKLLKETRQNILKETYENNIGAINLVTGENLETKRNVKEEETTTQINSKVDYIQLEGSAKLWRTMENGNLRNNLTRNLLSLHLEFLKRNFCFFVFIVYPLQNRWYNFHYQQIRH